MVADEPAVMVAAAAKDDPFVADDFIAGGTLSVTDTLRIDEWRCGGTGGPPPEFFNEINKFCIVILSIHDGDNELRENTNNHSGIRNSGRFYWLWIDYASDNNCLSTRPFHFDVYFY